MARYQTNGPGGIWGIDKPDQFTDEYHVCFISSYWKRFLALLCRPLNGISRRPAGRGAGDNIAAVVVSALCRQQYRRIFSPARLGLAFDRASYASSGAGT